MTKLSLNFVSILITIIGLAISAFPDTRDSTPVLILRLIDQTGVPPEILDGAKAHVDRIYQTAGIPTIWIISDSDNTNSAVSRPARVNGLELTVVLAAENISRLMCTDKTATGIALSNDGKGTRRAYVFGDRVIAEAERALRRVQSLNRPRSWKLILGHVIAHEVGHLMLPHSSHASIGIMRGQIHQRDVQDAIRGGLLFTPDQGGAMRSALQREAREL